MWHANWGAARVRVRTGVGNTILIVIFPTSRKGTAATGASVRLVLRAALFARSQCTQSTETSCPAARRAARQSSLRAESDTGASVESEGVQ